MPTKREARIYRNRHKRSYTRKEYIKSIPESKIKIFEMGNPNGDYTHAILLISDEKAVILSRSLESARVTAHRYLTDTIGRENYFLRIRPYPHEIIREVKFLGTAGADRIQKGMRHAWGKPTDRAARIDIGQIIIECWIHQKHLNAALEAIRRAKHKIGSKTRIEILPLTKLYPKQFRKTAK